MRRRRSQASCRSAPSSPEITRAHTRSHEITRDHTRSHEITRDHPSLPEITRDHTRSHEITHSCRLRVWLSLGDADGASLRGGAAGAPPRKNERQKTNAAREDGSPPSHRELMGKECGAGVFHVSPLPLPIRSSHRSWSTSTRSTSPGSRRSARRQRRSATARAAARSARSSSQTATRRRGCRPPRL